jgi:ribosome-associated translation inhibitor RaiA
MELIDLQQHIDKRIDKLEKKLDRHIEVTTTNAADLAWVKGSVKISITLAIAMIGWLIHLGVK